MRVGDTIRTLPTTRPKSYANVGGVIATRNGDEWGVLVKGKLVWFLEKEIELWKSARIVERSSTSVPAPGDTMMTAASPTGVTALTGANVNPLSGPSRPVSSSRPGSSPEPVSASPGPADGLSGLAPGERGPGGGIVAQCVACGQMWERPKQRGRPSHVCRECR